MGVQIEIITCPEWKARKPKHPIEVIRRSHEFIFHHTAGHHPEISRPRDESNAELILYAHAIQNQHMAPGGLGAPAGGIDSGHNFLIGRNGTIVQGRWLTVSAIEAGHMVASAHCPDKNDQIGIEHEHLGNEPMTMVQRHASARLMAWVCDHYELARVMPVYPHRKFFATSCPGNLAAEIPHIHEIAQGILSREGGV